MREEPGEAEGGAAAERRGSEAQGRKREQKKVRETEPGGGEVRLARGGPGPDGSVSGCARLGTSVFMVWVWLLTEANKKGRRKGSQESSPTPQFKSFNSLVLSFLYSSTLTSIYDYWKNHSLD